MILQDTSNKFSLINTATGPMPMSREFLKMLKKIIFLLATISISTSAPPERKCRSVWTDLNKIELKQIGVCTKELGWSSGKEKSQKTTCTMKCVLTKEGLIQEDGSIPRENYNSYLLDHFPPSLVERSNETFLPCLELFEGKEIVVDPDCKEYDPLVKCMARRFGELCRGLA